MPGCADYFAARIRATSSGSAAPWAAGYCGTSASSAMNPAKILIKLPGTCFLLIRLVSGGIYGSVYSLQGMRRIASHAFKQGVRNDSQELTGSAVCRDAG